MWIDIASIVFICVTMNHLGLIEEIEHIYGHRIKVLNCPKCATFWLTTAYGLWVIHPFYDEIISVLAVSFLASYVALWVELLEGFIDTLYLKLYGKITSADNDNEATASADDGNSAGSVPKL